MVSSNDSGNRRTGDETGRLDFSELNRSPLREPPRIGSRFQHIRFLVSCWSMHGESSQEVPVLTLPWEQRSPQVFTNS